LQQKARSYEQRIAILKENKGKQFEGKKKSQKHKAKQQVQRNLNCVVNDKCKEASTWGVPKRAWTDTPQASHTATPLVMTRVPAPPEAALLAPVAESVKVPASTAPITPVATMSTVAPAEATTSAMPVDQDYKMGKALPFCDATPGPDYQHMPTSPCQDGDNTWWDVEDIVYQDEDEGVASKKGGKKKKSKRSGAPKSKATA
jgi:hypothetical protein